MTFCFPSLESALIQFLSIFAKIALSSCYVVSLDTAQEHNHQALYDALLYKSHFHPTFGCE